jgi:predicted DNA-binding ribbon-helix-helix protein
VPRWVIACFPPFPRSCGIGPLLGPINVGLMGPFSFSKRRRPSGGTIPKSRRPALGPFTGQNTGGQKAGGSLFLCGRIESGYRSNRLDMKSLITGYSIVIAGRKTKVSLERTFWDGLHEIAKQRNETLRGLVNRINADRQSSNLSSAIRVFVLDYYRNRASAGSNASPKSAR